MAAARYGIARHPRSKTVRDPFASRRNFSPLTVAQMMPRI